MKINRINAEIKPVEPEDIYQPDNIIESPFGEYYLVVQDDKTDEYALVDLTNNKIMATRFKALKELAEYYYEDGDRLVDATLTVED